MTITETISDYIKEKSYNYAILIDGEWGCGKTYFVDHTLIPTIKACILVSQKSNKHTDSTDSLIQY